MANNNYFINKMSYSDWKYQEKMKKSSEYETLKPFHGSYQEMTGKKFSFPVSEFSNGSYKMAA